MSSVPKWSEMTRRKFLKRSAAVGAGTVALGVAVPGKRKGTGAAKAATVADEPPYAFPDQDSSEIRWGFLIDLNKCMGCFACAVACKTEFDVRLGVFRSSVIYGETGTYPDTERKFIPWLCNHCREPRCLNRCPVEPVKAVLEFPNGDAVEYWARATYQRPDGLVLVDPDRCIGCGYCVKDCPYGVRYLDEFATAGGNPADYGYEIENPHPARKCDWCIHRLQEGIVPACVNTCTAGARMIGNLNDPDSEINKRIQEAGDRVSVLLEAVGTQPQVMYIDLDETVYTQGRDLRKEAGNKQRETPDI